MKRIKHESVPVELTFYNKLSISEINYEQFKKYASERLRILKKFENNIKDASGIEHMDVDIYSHFYLRLIAAQAKWSSQWFVNMEQQLFKFRISKMTPEKVYQYFYKNFLPKIKNLNEEDKITKKAIYDCSYKNNKNDFSKINKIHFSKCSEIITSRRFPLEKGYLSLNIDTIKSFMTNEFRKNLEFKMNFLYDKIVMETDERLVKLNSDIFTTYTANKNQTNSISSIIDSEYLPICIKAIIHKMNVEKHLKFNDRNALCLFFKDLNVPVADTVTYLRSKLIQIKEKELIYNIRHHYGLEGKRANYSCYTCNKLISNCSDSNSVGCPFYKNKDFASQFVDIEDIEGTKNCRKYLKNLTNSLEDFNYNNPADFYRIADKEINKKSE